MDGSSEVERRRFLLRLDIDDYSKFFTQEIGKPQVVGAIPIHPIQADTATKYYKTEKF